MRRRVHHRCRTTQNSPVPSPWWKGLGRGESAGTRAHIAESNVAHHPSPSRGGGQRNEGFTLLEVILALVILGAALAMLSDVIQLASRHAIEARAETQAQSLAASIMDQVLAGAVEMTSVSRQQLEVDDTTPWVYSIEVGASTSTGISPVEVIVEQDLEPQFTPVKFHLMRWLPSVAELPESGGAPAGGAAGGGAGSGSSGSGASGSGGASGGAGSASGMGGS
jgi:general secretion pathway protein I